MHADHFADALKLTPTAVVTVSSMAGVQWSSVSYALASLYTLLLIIQFVISRIIKPWMASRSGK